jgi:hypothetical protein
MKLLKELLQICENEGWDEETKTTDPNLSPEERGVAAAYAGMNGTSTDWNPETDEYNPYPKGSRQFKAYERAWEETMEYLRQKFPHV